MITDPVAYLLGLERLGIKLGLENMVRLCAALGEPQASFASVLVAGTNGKGSVTAMVHEGLRAAGHHAGRYTSPHLERLEERVVIGDAEVGSEALRAGAGRVVAAVEALQRSGAIEAPPTFFECVTALAFELFREARVTVAVLEVGLGGRLDATNVVSPVAAAITSIGLDHQAQLGTTLAQIAAEKAGVVKRGTPVVVGELPREALDVVQTVCSEHGAPLFTASGCIDVDALLDGAPLALAGRHQRGNAAVAACLLQHLDRVGTAVPPAAIRTALTATRWPGRLELVHTAGTDVLLDAAHNADGVRALACHLREIGWTGATVVFGAMQDKDVAAMLAQLAPVCGVLICTTPETPRALPAADVARLAALVPGARWDVRVVADPATALQHALAGFSRVVAAGSIFLIGPLRGILRAR